MLFILWKSAGIMNNGTQVFWFSDSGIEIWSCGFVCCLKGVFSAKGNPNIFYAWRSNSAVAYVFTRLVDATSGICRRFVCSLSMH